MASSFPAGIPILSFLKSAVLLSAVICTCLLIFCFLLLRDLSLFPILVPV